MSGDVGSIYQFSLLFLSTPAVRLGRFVLFGLVVLYLKPTTVERPPSRADYVQVTEFCTVARSPQPLMKPCEFIDFHGLLTPFCAGNSADLFRGKVSPKANPHAGNIFRGSAWVFDEEITRGAVLHFVGEGTGFAEGAAGGDVKGHDSSSRAERAFSACSIHAPITPSESCSVKFCLLFTAN